MSASELLSPANHIQRDNANFRNHINFKMELPGGPDLENGIHPLETQRKRAKTHKVHRPTIFWHPFVHAPHLPHKHHHSEAYERHRAEAASWAQMSPLIAATLGPLAILLGIPSLTQRWHGAILEPPKLPNGQSNYTPLPDPTVNLALAGAALFCEIMGNALLILRFSNFHTKVTTWMSYGFWVAKLVLGISNYIQFGITHPQTDDIMYLEGFWVGVCSMGITLIIVIFLTFNLMFLHSQSPEGLLPLYTY
jgi:hypothetical protein